MVITYRGAELLLILASAPGFWETMASVTSPRHRAGRLRQLFALHAECC